MSHAGSGHEDSGDALDGTQAIYWTVEVSPTLHFRRRFRERGGGVASEIETTSRFRVSGYLSPGKDRGSYYLHLPGKCRFVLKPEGTGFVGITVLPPSLNRALHGGI